MDLELPAVVVRVIGAIGVDGEQVERFRTSVREEVRSVEGLRAREVALFFFEECHGRSLNGFLVIKVNQLGPNTSDRMRRNLGEKLVALFKARWPAKRVSCAFATHEVVVFEDGSTLRADF